MPTSGDAGRPSRRRRGILTAATAARRPILRLERRPAERDRVGHRCVAGNVATANDTASPIPAPALRVSLADERCQRRGRPDQWHDDEHPPARRSRWWSAMPTRRRRTKRHGGYQPGWQLQHDRQSLRLDRRRALSVTRRSPMSRGTSRRRTTTPRWTSAGITVKPGRCECGERRGRADQRHDDRASSRADGHAGGE